MSCNVQWCCSIVACGFVNINPSLNQQTRYFHVACLNCNVQRCDPITDSGFVVVSPGRSQHIENFKMTLLCCDDQGCGSIVSCGFVNVSSSLKQQASCFDMTPKDCEVQGCYTTVKCSQIQINSICHQQSNTAHMTLRSCEMQWCITWGPCVSGISMSTCLQQQLHCFHMSTPGRMVQRCFTISPCQVGIAKALEQLFQCLGIPGTGGTHHLLVFHRVRWTPGQHHQLDLHVLRAQNLIISKFLRPIFRPKLLTKCRNANLSCHEVFDFFCTFAFIVRYNSKYCTRHCGVHRAHRLSCCSSYTATNAEENSEHILSQTTLLQVSQNPGNPTIQAQKSESAAERSVAFSRPFSWTYYNLGFYENVWKLATRVSLNPQFTPYEIAKNGGIVWYNGGICSDPVGLLVHVCNGHVRAILGCKVCISAVLPMWTRKVSSMGVWNEGYPQIIAFLLGKMSENYDKPW